MAFQVEQLALTQDHRSPVAFLLPRPLSQGSLAHLYCSQAQDKTILLTPAPCYLQAPPLYMTQTISRPAPDSPPPASHNQSCLVWLYL